MRKAVLLPLLMLVVSLPAFSQDRDKVLSRVDDAGTILKEIMSAPDSGIPDNVIGNAECVAVIPSYLKGAFLVGAQYGKGLASCRTQNGWSAPAFFRMEGGSFGFQVGGQAVDLIMLIMNERGMRALLQSKFKVGADASVAAGPVGRHASGDTDWKMRAQVLTYSRARGVFAGVSLSGAVIKQDRDDTRTFYGRMVPYKSLLTGLTPVPPDARPFLDALGQYAPVVPAPAAAPATAEKSTGK